MNYKQKMRRVREKIGKRFVFKPKSPNEWSKEGQRIWVVAEREGERKEVWEGTMDEAVWECNWQDYKEARGIEGRNRLCGT
jgi:hypothetical protein